jgi:putative ubiquitin-RnfH superfamily antitoxin RatB of RatAB toxin-antitoxin module
MSLKIEVIYALKHKAVVKVITVDQGTTIQKAIDQSGLLTQHQEIDLDVNKVGIFSQLKTLDTLVKDGDRVEIYRPLIIDPKEARRKRASE